MAQGGRELFYSGGGRLPCFSIRGTPTLSLGGPARSIHRAYPRAARYQDQRGAELDRRVGDYMSTSGDCTVPAFLDRWSANRKLSLKGISETTDVPRDRLAERSLRDGHGE